jgi:phosphopantetheinyl transferase
MKETDGGKAGIWIFRLDDGKKPEERLETALRMWTGRTTPVSGEIIRGERGKPFLRSCPETGVSITHSGPFWVCGLSDRQLGIDLQGHSLRREEKTEEAADRYRKMAVRFFHEKEAEFVLEGNSFRRFFRIWAAKEAFVKLGGQGIDDSFAEFSVVPENGRIPDAAGETQPELSGSPEGRWMDFCRWQACGSWFAGTELFPGRDAGCPEDRYTLCICTEQPCVPELFYHVR